MKSCPTCNRTFDDTMSYCVVDGSILSAPFDPEATQLLPDSANTEPPPREISKPSTASDTLSPTIASPTPIVLPQDTSPGSPQPFDKAAFPKNKFKKGYVAITLTLLVVVFGSILFFALRSLQCPAITIVCFPNADHAYCNLSDRRASFSDYNQDISPMLGSFQSLAVLQPHVFSETVKVSWAASPGRIEKQYDGGEYIRIDTTGLAGREIAVTATFTGYSLMCSRNTVSGSFVAR